LGLESVTALSSIKRFNKGDVIAQEGSTAKELFILLQGSVGVYRNFGIAAESQVDVLSQGSFYGEMSLFLGRPQNTTLVALSISTVLIVNRKNINDFFATKPDMAFSMIEGICKKLDDVSELLMKANKNTVTQSTSKSGALFPEGHGSYTLEMDNRQDILYLQKHTCPLCGYAFENLTVITSKLRLEQTDADLRSRYKGIEPLHYDIVTCPSCFFSATNEMFPTASKKSAENVNKAIGPYKLGLEIKTGADRDAFTVFAGYYLAILCAPVVSDTPQMTTAGFHQKLSRLYQDCGDERMYLHASEKALEDYLYAYQYLHISEKWTQQLCYIIGDLYFRTGDYDQSRNYFFLAKTNKVGTNVLKRKADVRLEEIRELIKSSKT